MIVIAPDDDRILYFGVWSEVPLAAGEQGRQSGLPGAASVIMFRGGTVQWLGGTGPTLGSAAVFVDGCFEGTVEAHSPASAERQLLFERIGLDPRRQHSLRIEALRGGHGVSAGDGLQIHGIAVEEAVDYPATLARAAAAELSEITSGNTQYPAPETWKPVPYRAAAPVSGVTLGPGPLRDCFERNIGYLNRCMAAPDAHYSDAGMNVWLDELPGSAEGRMLGGAGHTLRWEEREDMRAIVDTVVASVESRQTADGWCLPYASGYIWPQEPGQAVGRWPQDPDQVGLDERRNYDRVNLTRGLLAAGIAGHATAYEVLRRFYDWLNASAAYPLLLSGSFSGSAHNCNNGHAGGLLMHFSPVGRPEDLEVAGRAFLQDFLLDQAILGEPLVLDWYPLHVPHSYLLLAFDAWIDHYRATGAARYLDASLGAWQIVHDGYEHVGGTIAICEEPAGTYPPRSLFLGRHAGETCGSVFWANFNHRLLQLFPDNARFADEIETVLLNVILAAQGPDGSIRYHNNLEGTKESPQCANTCCEVNGVPFIARIPELLYSVAPDGIFVNLFAASTIAWSHEGLPVTLRMDTDYPASGSVELRVATAAPVRMKVRIRVPGWVEGTVSVKVNGTESARGDPGGYVEIDRTWASDDLVSLALPMDLRLVRYVGLDQHAELDRYALLRGPVLMALTGGDDLDVAASELPERLEANAVNPLALSIAGYSEARYVPYWQVQDEPFTCFPTMR